MIRKLPSGKFQANYYYYDGSHLKKKTKSFATKTEAKDFELKGKANRGRYEYLKEHPNDRTIADLIQHYKSLARYTSLRKGTKKQYDRLIEHFLQYCQARSYDYVFNFTNEDARGYENYCHKKFTLRGVSHNIMVAKLLFTEEMNRDSPSITRNPFANIKVGKVPRKQPRFYSSEELEMFFSCCSPVERATFGLLLYTGMRSGEAFNLKWKNVTDKIQITSTETWKPKSFKSYRPIPLNEEALKHLEFFRGNGEYVLGGIGAGRIYKRFLRVAGRVKKKYGVLIDNDVHGFRRTFGSILLQQGAPIAVISNLLGHESINTTERLYASLREQDLQEAVTKMPHY